MHNKWVKICRDKGSILHTIICIYVLYEFCTQIVYIMFMMCALSRSQLMYTKRIQNFYIQNVSHISTNFCIQNNRLFIKCIPRFDKLLYTFCIQNLAGVVLLILYTKCMRRFVEIWYTFYIHFVYIGCIHLLQFVYTKCIRSFRVGICR